MYVGASNRHWSSYPLLSHATSLLPLPVGSVSGRMSGGKRERKEGRRRR